MISSSRMILEILEAVRINQVSPQTLIFLLRKRNSSPVITATLAKRAKIAKTKTLKKARVHFGAKAAPRAEILLMIRLKMSANLIFGRWQQNKAVFQGQIVTVSQLGSPLAQWWVVRFNLLLRICEMLIHQRLHCLDHQLKNPEAFCAHDKRIL